MSTKCSLAQINPNKLFPPSRKKSFQQDHQSKRARAETCMLVEEMFKKSTFSQLEQFFKFHPQPPTAEVRLGKF